VHYDFQTILLLWTFTDSKPILVSLSQLGLYSIHVDLLTHFLMF